jgi:RNA polymerase-associated protein
MTLYSKNDSAHSHCVRLVLAEKSIRMDIISVEDDALPEDLLDLNPYHSVPTFVDRELVLYDPRVIMEYLDERFPHPPLMPVDPVSRARQRLAMYRVERDWYGLIDEIEQASEKQAAKIRKILQESVLSSADVFAAKPYFLSDEFTLTDCSIAPVLWRLPYYGIELPAEARPINRYAERIFARPSFRASLTEIEREMRL